MSVKETPFVESFQPEMQATLTYKHKKFDRRKRSYDDSAASSTVDFISIDDASTARNNDTPISSISSDTYSSSDYKRLNSDQDFSTTTGATPPPPLKRRRLNNQFNDSGICLTPQKLIGTDISNVTLSPAPYYTPTLDATFPRYTSTPLSGTPPVTPTAVISPAALSPAVAILPRISTSTLQNICKYHGNMVRKFPKIERTPKDQERRNKNTLACRMSRRFKKLEHIAVEEQYKEFSVQHMEIVEASMRAAAYLNELMLRLASVNGTVEGAATSGCSESKRDIVDVEKPNKFLTAQPKPFSIEYLTRNDNNN